MYQQNPYLTKNVSLSIHYMLIEEASWVSEASFDLHDDHYPDVQSRGCIHMVQVKY